MTTAKLAMYENRTRVLDFTQAYSFDKLGFMIKKPEKEEKVKYLFVFWILYLAVICL